MKGQRKSKSKEVGKLGMSDRIEAFISELIEEDNEWVELGRNELANIFGCVPSQINYVISTRFTPEKGYIVESRRGGGGYIKIKRLIESEELIKQIPKSVDVAGAKNLLAGFIKMGILQEDYAILILSAVGDENLDDGLRTDILKKMIDVAINL